MNNHGFYRINTKYLTQLRNNNDNNEAVISTDITQLYYGPFTYNKSDYYIPLISIVDLFNGLRPERAIPVPKNCTEPENVTLKISDKEYTDLYNRLERILADITIHASQSKAEFSIYDIQPDYLKMLQGDDTDIIAYCGPIARKTGVNWFAPITKYHEQDTTIHLSIQNHIISGILDMNKLIPCSDEMLSYHNEDTAETRFCENNKDEIRLIGVNTLNMILDKPYLASRS